MTSLRRHVTRSNARESRRAAATSTSRVAPVLVEHAPTAGRCRTHAQTGPDASTRIAAQAPPTAHGRCRPNDRTGAAHRLRRPSRAPPSSPERRRSGCRDRRSTSVVSCGRLGRCTSAIVQGCAHSDGTARQSALLFWLNEKSARHSARGPSLNAVLAELSPRLGDVARRHEVDRSTCCNNAPCTHRGSVRLSPA